MRPLPVHRVCRCDTCRELVRDRAARDRAARRIIACTAHVFDLDDADLLGRSRVEPVPYARFIAMYLCRDLLGMPSTRIGRLFHRDHTTVLYGWREVEQRLAVSIVAVAYVEAVRDAFEVEAAVPDAFDVRLLPMEPLDRLVTQDALARCSKSTRTLFYRARTAGAVPAATADRLALRILGLHPILVWGDAWLYERDRVAS